MRALILQIILFLLITLAGLPSNGQKAKKSVSSGDYYEFFNSLFATDTAKSFNIDGRAEIDYLTSNIELILSDSTLFSKDDADFMRLQIKTGRQFYWRENKLNKANVIKSKKIRKLFKSDLVVGWERFTKQYKDGFWRLSIPLFTIDKKTCIAYKSRHCGILCGTGSVGLYKKIGGEWMFIKTVGVIMIS